MKKNFVCIIIAFCIAVPAIASAKAINMIFWYPGEAGSTEEAKPFLDLFFERVNRVIAPDKITGKYFNTVAEGLNYIKVDKPKVGIISYSAWVQNKNDLKGATQILSTLTLPDGKNTEHYALVEAASNKNSRLPLISSEPLSISFIKEHLFSGLCGCTKASQDSQIFLSLKKIAGGELKSFAILAPMEAKALANLSSPWSKELRVAAKSRAIPSAPVVLFEPEWKGASKFKEALLNMESDEEGRELLKELRLRGFAIPK